MVLPETCLSTDLQCCLETLRGNPVRRFVLLTASKDGSGKSWCPDCADAEPLIEEAAEGLEAGARILRVEISRAEWKEDPGQRHPFRAAPFKASGIPTLLQLDPSTNAVLKRYGEGECSNINLLSSLFSQY